MHDVLKYAPSPAELEEALRPMILSASGWRKIFAVGGEESRSPELAGVDQALCSVMAWAFHKFLTDALRTDDLSVCVGMDTRFTGPVMAERMLLVLLALGTKVEFLDVVAAPEIMAYVQKSGRHHGFVYLTASHNPLGHNGVKFGLNNGGVLNGAQAQTLIALFRSAALDSEKVASVLKLGASSSARSLKGVYDLVPQNRERSRQAYGLLCDEILTLEDEGEAQAAKRGALRAQIEKKGLGVVAEFNGSARTLSIDQDYLRGLGVEVRAVNAEPQAFVHRIVPEGSSLDPCRAELNRAHAHDPRFVLGYVPDCDGDRGNVVYFDEKKGQSEILEAQEVFALCVLSEMAGLVHYGHLTYEDGQPQQRVAVVCNDPTSLRIDRIAQAFGAQVFRAEVGEANVVNLARNLRTQGWLVRILGEGSNGGNITYPGAVRDPLSTLGSLLKLLTLRADGGRAGLFETWCQKSGQAASYRDDFTLADVITTLPAFISTSASEDRAVLKIKTVEHGLLKTAYEKHFLARGWKDNEAYLREKLGICAWEEINYEGTEERRGFGPAFRSGKQTGGFKIVLKDAHAQPIGSLWMRGSGTEPVFRIAVDIEGSERWKEAWLLEWHRNMILAVD